MFMKIRSPLFMLSWQTDKQTQCKHILLLGGGKKFCMDVDHIFRVYEFGLRTNLLVFAHLISGKGAPPPITTLYLQAYRSSYCKIWTQKGGFPVYPNFLNHARIQGDRAPNSQVCYKPCLVLPDLPVLPVLQWMNFENRSIFGKLWARVESSVFFLLMEYTRKRCRTKNIGSFLFG